MLLILSILLLSLFGVAISLYILIKKHGGEKMVCFIGADCDKVVKSRYSTIFFGIPNEILGILYYGSTAALTLFMFSGFESFASIPTFTILLTVGALAAFFSIVLVWIQAFIIKEWCEYCLISTGISIVIFILEIL